MTQKRLGICLIGTGFMGRAHSSAYRRISELPQAEFEITLQSIVGLDEARRRDIHDRYGWAKSGEDWMAEIQSPHVDVVDITTPTDLHAEIATASATAGKHVLCEKPLAMSVAEAEQTLAAATAAGVRHAVAFNYRFVPAIQLARRLIEQGQLGDIRHFRAHYLQDWLVSSEAPMSWRLSREVAGSGAHGDLNAHLIDLAHYLIGPIEEVVADSRTFVPTRRWPSTGETAEVTVDDATCFLARIRDGATGVFEASRVASGSKNRNEVEVEGSKGALRFNLERLNELTVYSTEDAPDIRGFRKVLVTEPEHPFLAHWWPPGHLLGWEHAHVHLIATFLNDIATGGHAAPTFEDGLACQKVLEACERSVRERQWVATGCQ
jgi:predicted dehydrogenase